MPALAVTDHEGLYGAVRFYQACKAAGIKPIVGVELTVESAVGRDGRPRRPGAAQPARPAGSSEAAPAAPGAAWPPPAGSWPPQWRPGRARRDRGASRGGLKTDEVRRKQRSGPPNAPRGPQRPTRYAGGITHLKGAATVPPAAARGAGGHHLVLLARDYTGWSNLCRIISAAHLEHPGEPPLARLATLAEHGGHLIALSACRRGEVWSRLLAGDPKGARAAASVFRDIFGRDFFIELQHELLPDSAAQLRALDLLAHELRLPTVATNDVHYTVKDDAPLHDVLAAEAANQPLPNPLGRQNAELYLKSPAQMWRLFGRRPEAFRRRRRHRRALRPRPGARPAPLPRLPAAARRDRLLAALEALLRRRRAALPAAHRRGHRPPRARAARHRRAGLRRVLPRRPRHRRVRPRAAASTTPAAAPPATASSATCCASPTPTPSSTTCSSSASSTPRAARCPTSTSTSAPRAATRSSSTSTSASATTRSPWSPPSTPCARPRRCASSAAPSASPPTRRTSSRARCPGAAPPSSAR